MYFKSVVIVKKVLVVFKSLGYNIVFFKYLNTKKENEKFAMFLRIKIL